MEQVKNELTANHRIWLKSITIALTLLFIETGVLLAIKQNSNFEIGHAPGRISLIFILALVIPHAFAADRRKRGLTPLNWFVWLAMAFGIWLLGPLTTYIIATFF